MSFRSIGEVSSLLVVAAEAQRRLIEAARTGRPHNPADSVLTIVSLAEMAGFEDGLRMTGRVLPPEVRAEVARQKVRIARAEAS